MHSFSLVELVLALSIQAALSQSLIPTDSVEQPSAGAASGPAGGVLSPVVAPPHVVAVVAPLAGSPCPATPPAATYVLPWQCPSSADGVVCAGVCTAGSAGTATATCAAGTWAVNNQCTVGGIYGFDDGTDGTLVPQKFLGLVWTGMRIANSAAFTACNSYSGFRHGMVSMSNVAYTLEAGAAVHINNVTVAVSSSASIAAPTTAQKITLNGLFVTAAWQDGLNLQLSSWAADGNLIGVKPVTLSFLRPTYVDLRAEPAFKGVYKVTLVGFGGIKLSCVSGTNVVVDDVDVRLHADGA